MLAEIGVRMTAMQSAFFRSTGNLFDFAMAVVVGGLAVAMVVAEFGGVGEALVEVEAAVVVGRNAVQAVRLWRLVDRYLLLYLVRV